MDSVEVMSQWGNNPATWEAIATVVGALGIFLVGVSTWLSWHALHESRSQRHAIEREAAARMRPWIGLFGFSFDPGSTPDFSQDAIKLLLRNFGALPAQSASLNLRIDLLEKSGAELDDEIVREEKGQKTLVPSEEGSYTIPIGSYPQFREWRKARHDVQVLGAMNYKLDGREFKTEFMARIRFSEIRAERDQEVRINWRNVTAV